MVQLALAQQCDRSLNTPRSLRIYLLSSPGVLYRPSASGPSAKPSNISFSHSRDRCSRSSVRQPESVRREKLTVPAFSSASTMDRTERYASRGESRRSAPDQNISQHPDVLWLSSPQFSVQMTLEFVVQSGHVDLVSHEPQRRVWATALVSERPFPSPSERRSWPLSRETPWNWSRGKS